jgi:hypothetical protein
MRRILILIIAAAFIAGMGTLTALDIRNNGVTPLDVVAVLIVALMALGILGALSGRPPSN